MITLDFRQVGGIVPGPRVARETAVGSLNDSDNLPVPMGLLKSANEAGLAAVASAFGLVCRFLLCFVIEALGHAMGIDSMCWRLRRSRQASGSGGARKRERELERIAETERAGLARSQVHPGSQQ